MQRVEVEKPGNWFWGDIAPFLVGWFVWFAWLFFELCVGCCLVWFAVVCFVAWFGWVFVCFVDCLVVVAGACVFNIRHVLDLLGIDSARPQRPWDARWIDVWRSWRRQVGSSKLSLVWGVQHCPSITTAIAASVKRQLIYCTVVYKCISSCYDMKDG